MNTLKSLYVVLGATLAISCGGATSGDDSRTNASGTSTGGTVATAGTTIPGTGLGGASSTMGGVANAGHPSGASSAFGGAASTGGSSAVGGSISAIGGLASTGGIKAAGGFTSTAGAVATGAMGTAGGMKGTAGNVASGGNAGNTSVTGGVTSIGADAGIGCSGSFETIQTGGRGLCVAKMVTIQGPPSDAGSADYEIDVTEVTQGQYDQWLTTNPALPASTDPSCGWKSTGSYTVTPTSNGTIYTGIDAVAVDAVSCGGTTANKINSRRGQKRAQAQPRFRFRISTQPVQLNVRVPHQPRKRSFVGTY